MTTVQRKSCRGAHLARLAEGIMIRWILSRAENPCFRSERTSLGRSRTSRLTKASSCMSDPSRELPKQWKEARRWLVKADDDLAAVRRCVDGDPPLVEPAAFHCQQAVEKILKALLVAVGISPPRIHDIDALVARAGPAFPELTNEVTAIPDLTSWYVLSRYPGFAEYHGPSADDVRSMLVRIESLRSAIDRIEQRHTGGP